MERIIKSKKSILRPKDLPHTAYLEELLAGAKPPAPKRAAARLQECQPAGEPPVLIRIETKAGHGSGKPMSKVIGEKADELSFLARIFGLKGP